jgi:hypothetical protein
MDKNGAKKEARYGAYMSFFACLSTLAIIGASHARVAVPYPLDYSALADAIVFFVIGIYILRMSKFAAVGALVLFFIETLWKIDKFGLHRISLVQWAWTAVFVFCYAKGIHGVYAYHRILKEEEAAKTESITEQQKSAAASGT